jgi:hypothetical protein
MGVPEKARGPEVSWRLARVLIGTGRREGFEEAQKMIAAGCVAGGSGVSGWLDVLEEIPAVSLQATLMGPVRERLADPAWNAELAPARRALLLARLDYAANFSGRGKVIDASVERWKHEDPVAVAKFLGDLGLYLGLLETFPAERVAEKPELFLPVLEAMEKTGAWEQVAPLLDAHGTRLPKSEELGWRAVAAAKTGDGPQRVQLWNAAMGEAKSGPQATAYLALNQLARRAGMTDEADQALVEAIRLGRGPLPLYADLKPLLQSLSQRGRENALLEICAIYL